MVEARDETFGTRLRLLREDRGLTQEELAARAGLSSKGISALERGERRRPHPHTLRALTDALRLSGAERDALLYSVPKRGVPAETLAEPRPIAALPAPSAPLVGRERDVAAVRFMLGAARLVTLTGPGGVGKTSLALEAAASAAGAFPDGAAFVDLAPVPASDLVLPAAARALGLKETGGSSPGEALRSHLAGRETLLVLDNFEHVIEAAPEIAGLVAACPGLVALVTSRAPLRVRGEKEYPLGPLTVPDPARAPDARNVAASPAARLFAERARESRPAFEVTDANAAAVAAICWRLDGLPLALELAAARVRFLGPTELLSRLDAALEAGGARDLPQRQRTMHATLDWSHGLLSDDEKALFRALSAFAGGFTLPAAEAVGGPDALIPLGSLVEQSLVTVSEDADSGGESRYGMLEPIRQYAGEKLRESGEEGQVRERHAAYFLRLAEEAAPELRGPRQVEALARLDAEHDNLRAAITWALSEGKIETAVRLCWDLFLFWWVRGLYGEGRRWIEVALERGAGLPPSTRGKALFVAGMMCSAGGDHEKGTALGEEAVTLLRSSGDRPTLAVVLASLGFAAARGRRDYAGATRLLEESLSLYRELGDDWGSARVLSNLARLATLRGDGGRAASLLERSLELARELGDRSAVAEALHNSAVAALVAGERERAAALLGEALALAAEVEHRSVIADCLEALACVASLRRDPHRSARLWASAEALRGSAGLPAAGAERPLYEGYLAAARAALDERTFRAEWAAGRAMTLEQTVGYAIGDG